MKIALIHEVTPEIIDYDLSSFDIITFDDGLFTQYDNVHHFLKYKVPLYFFISTKHICHGKQSKEIISSELAHYNSALGDNSAYMTWQQIIFLSKIPNCYIGGHSHSHVDITKMSLVEATKVCKEETEKMIKEFKKHKISISSFAYPYNNETICYKAALLKHGVVSLFGRSRIEISKLVEN